MTARSINHNIDRADATAGGIILAHRRSSDQDIANRPTDDMRSADVPGAAFALAVLSLIGMLNMMDRLTVAVVLQPIKQELRLTDDARIDPVPGVGGSPLRLAARHAASMSLDAAVFATR